MSEIVAGVEWNAPDGDHPARGAARRSMEAVVAGRRDAWLSLWAPEAVIEDPVGPSMLDPEGRGHRGPEGLAAFWSNHISTVGAFRFVVHDSFANGPACANVVTIRMRLGEGATMQVDAVIVYVVDADGRLVSLRAHWEPDRALATLTP